MGFRGGAESHNLWVIRLQIERPRPRLRRSPNEKTKKKETECGVHFMGYLS